MSAEIFAVPLIGQAGTMHDTVYSRRGLPWWPEFYADLEYDRHCNLIITRKHEPYEPEATAQADAARHRGGHGDLGRRRRPAPSAWRPCASIPTRRGSTRWRRC